MKPAICTNNPSQPYKYPQRNYNPVAQPAKNSEDRFHAEMKNLSQKDLPQSGNRPLILGPEPVIKKICGLD